MKKRSLDYDGLDGILQQPDPSIQPKAAWYQSGWIYGVTGIVLAGLFLLQKNPTQPVATSNNATEQAKSAASAIAANTPKPTESAHSAAEPVTIDQSVNPSPANTAINAPVAQSAEASTTDTNIAQTENQALQPSEAIPTGNDTPAVNSSTEALFAVHFKLDSSKLNALSSSESAELINAAKRCAKLIKLTGHTCNLGTDANNKTLGLTRAKAVKKLLLNNGFDSNRIITTSAGMTKPVAANDTPTGQALNRRTELACQDD